MARGRDASLLAATTAGGATASRRRCAATCGRARSSGCRPGSWPSSPSCAGSTRPPRVASRSSGVSTSPGAPRSSHGTRRTGAVAEALVRDRVPVGASENERVAAGSVVGRGDDSSALAPRVEHALDRLRREVRSVGEDDRRLLRRRAPSAARPQRSDAPGPSAQSAQRTIARLRRLASSCAPSTTTISSTEVAWSRSRTRGRRMCCFGLPNRDASPAARTIAATRIVSSRRR